MMPLPSTRLAAFGLLASLLAVGTACGNNDVGGAGGTIDGDGDGDGFSDNQGDCDDENDAVYPGAEDFYGDGVDQDCSGTDGVDVDRDGYPDRAFGGDDCNDLDASVYPTAEEIGWDDIDQDCNGSDLKDYVEIDAGENHTCAIKSSGEIVCWGSDETDQLRAPSGDTFVKISQGMGFGCALDLAGAITCWGDDSWGQVSGTPTSGVWKEISAGWETACAISDGDKLLTCWGKDKEESWDDAHALIGTAPTDVRLDRVAVGNKHACAIAESDGRAICWGVPGPINFDWTKEPVNNVDWIMVSVGSNNSCAVAGDRSVDCWGDNDFGQTSPDNDPGPYYDIDTYDLHTCAIESNIDVACWGDNLWGQVAGAPYDGVWSAVAVGRHHSCALSNIGAITCWGRNHVGQLDVP